MITPLDIQNKEFSKSVNGYKKDDVDEFLDLLTVDMEKVLSENASLRSENVRMAADLEKYKGSEGAVLETLEAAKALMGEISASAERRAEILIKNTELDAELIRREAKESVERLVDESQQLRNRFTAFKSKYKNLLESELERFDTLSAEIFEEFGFDDQMPEVKPRENEKTIVVRTDEREDFSRTMINIRTEDGA